MISLVFIVGFFSLLLLPLTCLSLLLFSLHPPHPQLQSTAAAAKPPLSSIFTLLLHHTLFPNYLPHSAPPNYKAPGNAASGVRRYAARGEAEDCGVCLCEVEQGDEISDLRCSHLFHKECLDAWVGSGRPTCPLCRGSVFAPAAAEEGGPDVLVFRFMTNSRRAARGEGSWWLR